MKPRVKETTKLRKNIEYLRIANKQLREQVFNLEQDRKQFRITFVHNLTCAIELLGKGQTWDMEYVVKTLSQQMTKFEKWYWG